MVGRKIDDHLDTGRMRRSHHRVEVGPGVAAVAEVFLDSFEVAALIAMVRSLRVAAAIGMLVFRLSTAEKSKLR